MKDSPTGAAEKIRKSSDYVFWGIGLAVSLILIAYTSYFGFYVNLDRSENPEDWVHFSAIFSNILKFIQLNRIREMCHLILRNF